jgi:formylglycine-generating enzyme required for sulfatase activity
MPMQWKKYIKCILRINNILNKLLYVTAMVILCICSVSAKESEEIHKPWDGKESIDEYSRRRRLANSIILNLGSDVTMECVLVPDGMYIMGAPMPETIYIGLSICAISIILILTLICAIVYRSFRTRRRIQYSLLELIIFTNLAGFAIYGFIRYSHASEAYRQWVWLGEESHPSHKVNIIMPYYMSKYEVTQKQYKQVMGCNPSSYEGPDMPVHDVSWDDAKEFCRRASDKLKMHIRLPSESEWEYACRAGTYTAYNTGNDEACLARAGWYLYNSTNYRPTTGWAVVIGRASPVGMKEPNRFGLYDMHGNVWEYCEDDWHDNYYGAPRNGVAWLDSKYPGIGDCVVRGGSWREGAMGCLSRRRQPSDRVSKSDHYGFRVLVPVRIQHVLENE